MPELLIVVCGTQNQAETKRARMIDDGFRPRGEDPKLYELITYDASSAGGSAEGFADKWVVIGEK